MNNSSFNVLKKWKRLGLVSRLMELLFCLVSMAMAAGNFLFSYKVRCSKTATYFLAFGKFRALRGKKEDMVDEIVEIFTK